jgi:hypothetical protein
MRVQQLLRVLSRVDCELDVAGLRQNEGRSQQDRENGQGECSKA